MSAPDGASRGIFFEAIRNFLGPIYDLLLDESISEILINGPSEIFVERGGKLYPTDSKFETEDDLMAAVNSIAQSVGRRINPDEPRLDARLPDGSRVHAVLPPCARNGTTVSIRKFIKKTLTFKDFIQMGTLTSDAAGFLEIAMFLGKNILVSGGTGSGKTTLLGLLCSRIPRGQRVIVIEDASELSMDYEHVVFFETKLADESGRGKVTMEDLLKSSLRLRPDRIVVGEVRGSEAMELLQAMNTGHKGCLGTIHANSPNDALVRIEALALGGDRKISERALQYSISSAIDLVVQISRLPGGARKVVSIAEVRGLDSENNYIVTPIYELRHLVRGSDGQLKGEIEPTGELPSFIDEIEDNRIPFPRSKFFSKKVS